MIAPLRPFAEIARGVRPGEFVTIEGRSIRVRDEGEGLPIILLHGLASSLHSFREIFPRVEKHRLVAIDLDGFGETERPRDRERYRLDAQAETIARIMNAKGIDQAVVLGHSYGAMVAAAMTRRFPDRVSATVLVAPPSIIRRKPPLLLRGSGGGWIAYLLVRLLLSRPARFHELSLRALHRKEALPRDVSEVYRRSLLVEGLRDAFFGLAAAFSRGSAEGPGYENIRGPVLVVAGEQDDIVSIEEVRTTAGTIPGAKWARIENCGHCVTEEQPEEFVAVLSEFLADIPPG